MTVLNMTLTYQYESHDITGFTTAQLTYSTSQDGLSDLVHPTVLQFNVGPLDDLTGTYPDFATAIEYIGSQGVDNILGQANFYTDNLYDDYNVLTVDLATQQALDLKQNQSGVLDGFSDTDFGTNDVMYATGSETFSTVTSTSYGRGLLNSASAAALKSSLSISTSDVSGYVAPVSADWSSSSGLSQIINKPSLSTVATSGSYNDLSDKPSIPAAASFSNPTRSLNSSFQISSSRNALVSYTVDVSSALSLSGGQTGTVTLKYADDSGFTTNVVSVQSAVNGNTGTLTIGLGLTQTGTASITGMIPAGKYVQIQTANTSGTPTFTFRAAQEVLL